MALIDSIVAYWKLNEASGNATDEVASFDLTDNSSVGAVTGHIDGGRGDFTSPDFLNSSSVLAIASNIDYSISCWLERTDTTNEDVALSAGDNTNTGDYEAFLNLDVDEKPKFYTATRAGSTVSITAAAGISQDTWTHVVMTHIGSSNLMELWVNGVSEGTATGVVQTTTKARFEIGRRHRVGGVFGPDINVDEVGIWSKVLADAEVAELYNSGTGLTHPFINNITVEPSTLALSSSQSVPSFLIDISQGALGLTSSLLTPIIENSANINKGAIGTKEIRTSHPVDREDGKVLSLIPRTVNIIKKDRVGLDA